MHIAEFHLEISHHPPPPIERWFEGREPEENAPFDAEESNFPAQIRWGCVISTAPPREVQRCPLVEGIGDGPMDESMRRSTRCSCSSSASANGC